MADLFRDFIPAGEDPGAIGDGFKDWVPAQAPVADNAEVLNAQNPVPADDAAPNVPPAEGQEEPDQTSQSAQSETAEEPTETAPLEPVEDGAETPAAEEEVGDVAPEADAPAGGNGTPEIQVTDAPPAE